VGEATSERVNKKQNKREENGKEGEGTGSRHTKGGKFWNGTGGSKGKKDELNS